MDRLNLPPQAYTREVLAEAFEWLKTQPVSVKEKATSPDLLVSLYTHSKRHGNAFYNALADEYKKHNPDDFKSDLKNLAQGLKQFDTEAKPEESVKKAKAPKEQMGFDELGDLENKSKKNTIHKVKANEPKVSVRPPVVKVSPLQNNFSPTQPTQASETKVQREAPPSPAPLAPRDNPSSLPAPQSASAPPLTQGLDSKTLEILNEVKTNLNLSQDYEVMRMLISLGYERIKQLFPPKS